MSRIKTELRERIAIVIFLLPFAAWVFADDGWLNAVAIATVLGLAAYEYSVLYRGHNLRPSFPLVIGGVFLITVGRHAWNGEHAAAIFMAVCLAAQVWHLIDYERGAEYSATDFAVSVAGIFFLGWIGSYLVSLRRLPEGQWWILIALPSVWVGDTFAYLGGKAFGRHQFSRRISPKKTWEGYLIGACAGALSGVGLAYLWRVGAGAESQITILRSIMISVAVNILAPIGDLGVSMLKRENHVKDASKLLPGHGGILDRLDSSLWSGVITYYLIIWLTA